MKAFHGDTKIKKQYLARVESHRIADEIVKGRYWEAGKGCAVGCTIHGSDHKAYETELGIPEWLARVEDTLFEGMSTEKSKQWPGAFLKAIRVGADLEPAKAKFIVVVLKHSYKTLEGLKVDAKQYPDVAKTIEGSKEAVKKMIAAQRKGDAKLIEEARLAARSAWLAARSARSAAWSAARSAAWSAESAESAAWSAAWSAWLAARSAARSARSAAFDFYADELLKILRKCK